MPDFSVILQSPQMRSLVQENAIQASFADGLYPKNIYRTECTDEEWAANVGDDKLFTGAGLMATNLRPLRPGVDPTPGDYTAEQWRAQCQKYANTIDTHMPTAIAATVNKLIVDQKRLGENCAQTINRLIREKLHNASNAGNTNAVGAQVGVTTLRVARLNGFTRARRPDLSTGAPVRFDPVTSSNPLAITVFQTAGGATPTTVIGYTPDFAGDEVGTGTLTLSAAVTVAARDAVIAASRTFTVISGGGNSIDALTGGTDLLHLTDMRSAIARLATMNVPKMADGTYHMHLDPISFSQIYADPEFQILNRGRVDAAPYEDYVVNKILGCSLIDNNEAPQTFNVVGGSTATYDASDPAGFELFTTGATTGSKVHRVLFVGGDSTTEYYVKQGQLITEAGVGGRIEDGVTVTNNGMSFVVDNVQIVMRQPQDRLQEMVAQSWKFEGDWVVRTDAATGDGAAYKRVLEIQHTE